MRRRRWAGLDRLIRSLPPPILIRGHRREWGVTTLRRLLHLLRSAPLYYRRSKRVAADTTAAASAAAGGGLVNLAAVGWTKNGRGRISNKFNCPAASARHIVLVGLAGGGHQAARCNADARLPPAQTGTEPRSGPPSPKPSSSTATTPTPSALSSHAKCVWPSVRVGSVGGVDKLHAGVRIYRVERGASL
jgi:hypothetical protein